MNHSSETFIQILSSFATGEQIKLSEILEQEWIQIYEMAQKHKLELAVYETIYKQQEFQKLPPEIRDSWKSRVRQVTVREIQKIQRFWEIYQALLNQGIRPLIIKGVVCRFLYEKPYARPSADEDLLIPPEEEERCCQVLRSMGMNQKTQEESSVISFEDKSSSLHLEVHKKLFDGEYVTGDVWNQWFTKAFDTAVCAEIDGYPVWSLSPTLHMLYLFLHWIKHFVGSGIGVRQVCDISKYINTYGTQIDWEQIWRIMQLEKWEVLCGNVINLGIQYFGLDCSKMKIREELLERADFSALLEDLLDAGIYGTGSVTRMHSSVMTLQALRGKRGKLGILFPPVRELSFRYPYLKKKPYLLPVSWVHRLFRYLVELLDTKEKSQNSPQESLALGKNRIELLRKYGIVK